MVGTVIVLVVHNTDSDADMIKNNAMRRLIASSAVTLILAWAGASAADSTERAGEAQTGIGSEARVLDAHALATIHGRGATAGRLEIIDGTAVILWDEAGGTRPHQGAMQHNSSTGNGNVQTTSFNLSR